MEGEDAAPEVLLKEALAARPEIASGEAQIRAQELTVQAIQGGLTHGQVREARANVTSLQAQLDLQKQQVRLDVEQARLAVRAAVATLGASKDASLAARETRR